MKFNQSYSGQYYQLQNGQVYVLRGDGRFAYAGADTSGIVGVQLTGYYKQGADGNNMYQTTGGGWIKLADGWKNTGYATLRYYSAKDAQYYVDKIVKANAQILQNNLFCARFANKLTDDEQFQLYSLQTRLESRNNQLQNDGLCSDLKVSTPPGYSLLDNSLSYFMNAYANGVTIGAIISVSTIIISAVVIASLATTAYFAYKYLASEAEKDVKYSEELTKTLMEKLTPEEYQQLLEETQGIVTKTRLSSQFQGGVSLIKWGLIAVAGLAIYKAFKNRKTNSNSIW